MSERVDQEVRELYSSYMEMIRYFVLEGMVELDQTTKYDSWAKAAALGNDENATALAQLARITELAHKQRFLEGMPMFIDMDTQPTTSGTEDSGFRVMQRFHFMRLFLADQRALADSEPARSLPGIAKALYMDPNPAGEVS